VSPLGFMIIGVQKGGTTALSHFLAQHPQVAMAKGKEVHLFDAPDYHIGLSTAEIQHHYQSYFPQDCTAQLCAEATPIYIYWPEIIPELYRYNPALKLIVMLRDPIERALSQYRMERARGFEPWPLSLALLIEPLRLLARNKRHLDSASRHHSYGDRGHYVRQLIALRRVFPDEQILIIDNSELIDAHDRTMERMTEFLDLPTFAVAQEVVFASAEQARPERTARALLWLRFKIANRGLKKLLRDMGYSPDWPWLR